MGEPVACFEPAEYYSLVTEISVNGGPGRWLTLYQSEFIMMEVFAEIMPGDQNSVTVAVFNLI